MSFINCDHEYDFVSASRGIGEGMHSHEVRICKKCGQFHIHTRKGGTSVNFTFNLMIPDQVEAAGKYVEYLIANGVTYQNEPRLPSDDERLTEYHEQQVRNRRYEEAPEVYDDE